MGMEKTILIDSGPIVSLINQRDTHHTWCLSQFEIFTNPLRTCDAVVSEAFFCLSGILPMVQVALPR